jgi:hypothetical protein
MTRSGRMTQQPSHTLHYAPTYHVQAIDSDGVKGMLDQHDEEFTRHYNNHVRKTNR